MKENAIYFKKHTFLCMEKLSKDFIDLETKFCGQVLTSIEDIKSLDKNAMIYIGGNIQHLISIITTTTNTILIIKEISYNYEINDIRLISIGQVPLNLYNVGVFVPEFLQHELKLFEKISAEHTFQDLTLGDKIGKAHRTGAYFTKVEEKNNDLYFNLLRCSSSFKGPTNNFCQTDQEILLKTNEFVCNFFKQPIEFNHVLAQIYHNQNIIDENGNKKEKKAVIQSHSDKTKDMPLNGLIAFFTLYQNLNAKKSKTDKYDYVYKNISVLTTLVFELKKPNPNLISKFVVTLYPGSIFIIPLSTNREYTHAIVPSILPIEHLPIRMGYVIRCSKTRAIFKNNQTFIINDDDNNDDNNNKNTTLVKLEEPSKQNISDLKKLYAQENLTNDIIEYPFINFTMNHGDYIKPIL